MVVYTDNGFSLKSDFKKKIIYTDNSSNDMGSKDFYMGHSVCQSGWSQLHTRQTNKQTKRYYSYYNCDLEKR